MASGSERDGDERPGGENVTPLSTHARADVQANPSGTGSGFAAFAIGAGLLAAVAGFVFYLANLEPAKPHDFGNAATLLPTPRPVQPFALVDQHGERFGREQLEGQWSLFFFGYTYCPDICPMTLQTLGRVKQQWDALEAEAAASFEPPQVVFVSVDPERDSSERIGEYVAYFDSTFVGATGPNEELARLATSVGVYFAKVDPEARGEGVPSAADYLVDHSASLYLVDPQARLFAVLDEPGDIEAFADLVTQIQQIGHDS